MKKKKEEKSKKNLEFRERKLSDILTRKLEHPLPVPGYKSTLMGAPGWESKENPLGLRIPAAPRKKNRRKFQE